MIVARAKSESWNLLPFIRRASYCGKCRNQAERLAVGNTSVAHGHARTWIPNRAAWHGHTRAGAWTPKRSTQWPRFSGFLTRNRGVMADARGGFHEGRPRLVAGHPPARERKPTYFFFVCFSNSAIHGLGPPSTYPVSPTFLPSPFSAMMVGKPSILYLAANSSLAFFNSAVCFLPCGKSSSTRTRFFFAYSVNSGLEKTSLCNLMHQPHQSEPVKSSITSFFSALALATAFGTSVIHVNSSAVACNSIRPPTNPIIVFFIIFLRFGVPSLDARQFNLFRPDLFPASDRANRLPFQRPAVKRAVERFASFPAFVKYPGALRIKYRHIGIRSNIQCSLRQIQQFRRCYRELCYEVSQAELLRVVKLH